MSFPLNVFLNYVISPLTSLFHWVWFQIMWYLLLHLFSIECVSKLCDISFYISFPLNVFLNYVISPLPCLFIRMCFLIRFSFCSWSGLHVFFFKCMVFHYHFARDMFLPNFILLWTSYIFGFRFACALMLHVRFF